MSKKSKFLEYLGWLIIIGDIIFIVLKTLHFITFENSYDGMIISLAVMVIGIKINSMGRGEDFP